MSKNTPVEYKKRIREKYEAEKNGIHSDIFLNPSRAKLRKLCFEIFKENTNPDDLRVFESFFKFKFSLDCGKKMKDETDKFRPIENFLKGETEPADFETVNMAAILVNFHPRPLSKFSKTEINDTVINEPSTSIEEEPIEPEVKIITLTNNELEASLPKNPANTAKKKINKKVILLMAVIVVLGTGFSVKHFFFNKNKCLEWQKDHYVVIDCSEETNGKVIIPFDESLTDFRRIWACDTTTFFRDGKAVLWYCKSGDEIELYNKPGFDPVFKKPLKAITPYMIDKYFKN